MGEKRLEYWDIAKGIAIILVIFGHSLQYSCKGTAFYDDFGFKFIYGMHMPIFMFISGYFCYFTVVRHSIKEVLTKRIQQCLVPIVTMVMLEHILHFDFSIPKIISDVTGVHYWFLWAVLVLSCLVLTIKKLPPPLESLCV